MTCITKRRVVGATQETQPISPKNKIDSLTHVDDYHKLNTIRRFEN